MVDSEGKDSASDYRFFQALFDGSFKVASPWNFGSRSGKFHIMYPLDGDSGVVPSILNASLYSSLCGCFIRRRYWVLYIYRVQITDWENIEKSVRCKRCDDVYIRFKQLSTSEDTE